MTDELKRTDSLGQIFVPIANIEVNRERRQRRTIDISALLDSIKQRGIVSPIIVSRIGGLHRFTLVAGERRLTCAIRLGYTEVPVRLLDELPPVERQIIELEENIRRSELDWRDQCEATLRIHELYGGIDSGWTQERTASAIGLESGWLSCILRVAGELRLGTNALLNEAQGIRQAYNIITRHDSRKIDDAFNELIGEAHVQTETAQAQPTTGNTGTDSSAGLPTSNTIRTGGTPLGDVRTADFVEWVSSYTGPPFTFVHCDFPYGIRLDQSDQGNTATWGAYGDSPETYWALCKALGENLDKLLAPSSHLMFWLSARHDIQAETRKFFSAFGIQFNPTPLIWFKSDGKGILPDPKRGPRHVYETALFASRGDRLIHQAVSDCFAQPKGEASHQSEKPEQMLRHFFRMFVSDGTSMLDPTCGSGSSLCAATSLGAGKVLGLEVNPEWARSANARVVKSRLLTVEGLFSDTL